MKVYWEDRLPAETAEHPVADEGLHPLKVYLGYDELREQAAVRVVADEGLHPLKVYLRVVLGHDAR